MSIGGGGHTCGDLVFNKKLADTNKSKLQNKGQSQEAGRGQAMCKRVVGQQGKNRKMRKTTLVETRSNRHKQKLDMSE